MSVVVKYGDIAVGAKEAFNLYATDESYFSKLSQIKEDISVFPNFGNPLERYSVALDGSVLPLPSNKEDINIGWWSEQLSNEQGIFEIPIVLEMASEEYFTGTAITITFDAPKEIYATDLSIDWYRDGELLSQKKFKPTNARYSCENRVEFYNKIIITFNSLNRPLNRLKIKSIDHGSISTFTGGNLKKCNITQKISAISTELPISTASILLKGEAGEEYAFQKRQPLSVFSNDSLQMKLFVKKASRKSKDEWDIQAEDYVGVLDSVSFYGGIYEDESAGDLLIKIFNKAKVPYDIEADIMAETVSGYIPFGTCRNATMQVLFAVGAIIDTSNSEVIKVKRMSQDVSQKIGKERIFQGLRVVDDTRITAVSLTAHTYKAIEDSLIVYDANKSGEGVNIFVKFNEPLHDLSIQDGEILESGHNYAIINAGTNCKLNGQKYEHSSVIKTLYNDLVLSTDTENVKSINKATLVTQKNLDKLLNLCYNYYEKTQTINAKIIERKYVSGGDLIRYGQGIVYGTYKYRTKTLKEITYDEAVRLGDRISIDTSYQGIFTGVVESETFSLSGNSIAKDVLIK